MKGYKLFMLDLELHRLEFTGQNDLYVLEYYVLLPLHFLQKS